MINLARRCDSFSFKGVSLRRNWVHSSSAAFSRQVDLSYTFHDKDTRHSNKPPIIICHGLFGNQRNWLSLSKRLNIRTGRKVITYDAVNHGTSSHHPEMSYIDMAHDLVNLMKKLKLKKSLLIGHSMGGKTVMSASLLAPGMVEKLVIVDIAPTISSSLSESYGYMKGMKKIDLSVVKTKRDVENEVKKFVPSSFVVSFLMTNLLIDGGGLRWRVNLDALIENYHYIHGFPEFDQDSIYNGPSKFIGGGKSKYLREVDYPLIKRRFPQSDICHIPGAGHWVHSEKPTEFIEITSKFIDS